jgi:GNAT superfamily N-acetyltransferase
MELTRTIWDGEDYVPHVWLDWYSDPLGLLAVAEFGGQVVGLGKLSQFSAVDWWMEGLRVHPNRQGQGIASHLHDYLLRYWLNNGAGTIRLVTASFRTPIHRICERTGLQKIVELTPFLAQTIDLHSQKQVENQFTLIKANQVEQANKKITTSPIRSYTSGLMDIDWQWVTPSIEHIHQAVSQEQAYWWRDQRAVLMISEDNERSPRTIVIRLIACHKGDLVEILRDFRWLAGHLGFDLAGWIAPLHRDVEPMLNQAGFQRDWDSSLYIFERRHPNS